MLLIIILSAEIKPDGPIFETIKKHKTGTLLMFSPSAFLLQSDSPPAAIVKDLSKDLDKMTVSIFSSPSSGFWSHGFTDEFHQEIVRLLLDQGGPRQVILG